MQQKKGLSVEVRDGHGMVMGEFRMGLARLGFGPFYFNGSRLGSRS